MISRLVDHLSSSSTIACGSADTEIASEALRLISQRTRTYA